MNSVNNEQNIQLMDILKDIFIDEHQTQSLGVLNAILNGMDAYLYVSDLQTDEILFINDRMKEHFGLGDEAVGGVCWQVIQPGLKKRCDLCSNCRLIDEPNSPVIQEGFSNKTSRYYRHIDRIIEWPNGKMVHLRHSTDITDIKLAEELLKKRLKQQELMSTISQSFTTAQNTDYLIREALEKAGKFVGVNQTFLAKYQRDEGCLVCLYEWYDEEGQPYIGNKNKWPISPDMDIYEDLTVTGYAAVSDYNSSMHPNFEVVRDYNLRAFLNISIEVSGEFWGVLGFIINKRRYDWSESDIHLGKMIAGVFSGVISRSLVEESLLKAKDMAERASKAKGEFLSRMSHEIRTPMNAIIGMTRIAMDSRDVEKMKYCIDRIDNASKHLMGLINDILDMSKIEANKLLLSPTEFDFEKMLMNITGVINFRVEEKKQNMIIYVDNDVPPVIIGDEMRLSQVIANLLSNAVKFTHEEGVIMLNVHNVGMTNDTVTLLFEVIDNGVGVSKEEQDRLFSPFEQADGGIARKYGGTGLGLTISKGIVELMGGAIWIEPGSEHGAKFSFTVKMQVGRGFTQPTIADEFDKNSYHVLVVEGSPELRDYFTRVMSELDVSCDITESGSAALEAIKGKGAGLYKLCFVDWNIPDFDGVALIKKIKRINRDNTAVLIITETDWSNVENDAIVAGVDKFVFKPLFPSKLISVINEAVGVASEDIAVKNKAHKYNFERHTLLVAEDIEINREIILALLEDTNVSIDFALDGIETLAMIEKNLERYSLILMDIHMPEMDGYEATQRIRALDRMKAKRIPIIAMTANVFREDIEKCLQVGMNDHIGKPVNTEELLSKLERYLNYEIEIDVGEY